MTTSYTTYQLPISYSEIHIAIIGQENERNKGLGLRPDGLNSFNAAISVSGDTQNMRYLSIGKQQWGSNDGAQNNFPIPFSNCLNLQQWQWDISAMNNSGIVNNIQYDDTGYTCNGNYKLRFLAVGIAQQWGIKLAESTEYPYIWAFPVPFASKNFGVFVTNNELSINNGAIGVYDVDTQFAKIALYGGDYDNAAFLFAIGQQQTSRYRGHYRQNPKTQLSQHH